MIDQIASLNLDYLIDLSKRESDAVDNLNHLKKYLDDNNCKYGNKSMPTLLKPNFISPKQTKTLQYAVENISGALNKFIDLYLHNKQIQSIMKFGNIESQLLQIDPGYNIPLVIARLDAFMEGYSLKFLEFNCDSPAGIAYSDVLEDGFKEILNQYPVIHSWKIDYTQRQERLYQALMNCYAEFKSNHPSMPSQPTIAIVDWDNVATAPEFELLRHFFEGKGIDTVITSPQKFKISNGKAKTDGQEVHLIYKRVITRELVQKWDEVQDFVQSIKDGLVCTCNSFRSLIVGNKKVLALLTDPRFQEIYTEDELTVIKRTVPWTKILADTKVMYRGMAVHLPNFVADNKDKLVLKHAISYGGKDVFLGNETGQKTWEKIIDNHIDSESWVVQSFVNIPQEIFPVIDESVSLKLKKVNINPFALLGKYSGTISRVSDSSIINVSAGGELVPTMSVVRKKDILPE